MKAVIDRFEGKFAVLLVGEDETRMEVLRKLLPKGAKEGHWLQVEILDGAVLNASLDAEETARTKERIAEKLAHLRSGEHLKK